MARKSQSEKDPARGQRFRSLCQGLFPGKSRAYVAERLGGVSGGTIRNWELGSPLSTDVLSRLEEMGVSCHYLMVGEGPPMVSRDDFDESQDLIVETIDPKRLAKIIGANLKHLRKQRFPGWGGQKKFADFLGISANDLCVYEYGRAIPNEHRLTEMASRLGLEPECIMKPLEGVVIPSAPVSAPPLTPLAVSEQAWREKVESLNLTIARLEGRLEVMEEQAQAQNARIQELMEANYALRNLLFLDDSEEAAARRQRALERLGPAMAELIQKRDMF